MGTFKGFWLALGLSASSAHAQPQQSFVDSPYPTGDAVNVYRSVFDVLYRRQGESPPRVVLWYRTVRQPRGCSDYPCPAWPKHASVIDSATIRAFESVSIGSAPIDSTFSTLPVTLFREEDQVQLTDIGAPIRDSILKVERNGELMPFWLGFRVRYPGAWGYVTLSQVGFNAQHTEAIVQVVQRCGTMCGSIEEMFLRKESGRWVVAERIVDGMAEDRVDILRRYISADGYSMDSVVLGSLRYVGPNAHRLADFRRERDSVARAKSDSIALDAAPRRIRGTVTNRKSQQPIAFAQLFVVSAQAYPTGKLTRIVADKYGRYEVRNPPLGGTMLEVQCPGRAHVDGRTLDAPSLYVHPAIDTVINLRAPDIAPCRKSRSIRR
jgi:hypothetical protein